MEDSFSLEKTFSQVLSDISNEQSRTRKKPSSKLNEHDYLLIAFMNILKAYMLRMNSSGNKDNDEVSVMGA